MEILLKMIPVTERLPEDKQNVLIDNGVTFQPATYDARTGVFGRYSNYIDGDRAHYYFHAGVTHWCPFPETMNKPGFKAEQEKPLPWGDIPQIDYIN